MILKCDKCGHKYETPVDHRGAICTWPVGNINPQNCGGRYHEIIEVERTFIGAKKEPVKTEAVVLVDRDEVIQRLVTQVDSLMKRVAVLEQRHSYGPMPHDNFAAHHSTPPEPPKPKTLDDYCKHLEPVMPYHMSDGIDTYKVCGECHRRVMPGKDD